MRSGPELGVSDLAATLACILQLIGRFDVRWLHNNKFVPSYIPCFQLVPLFEELND